MAVMGSTPLIPRHRSGRSQWLGLLAPKGTPAQAIARLHAESAKVLATPAVRERLAQAALQAVGSTPREFQAQIQADIARCTQLAQELGIRPQ